MKRRVVMARLGRMKDDDGSFDREFWSRVGPDARVEATWEMSAKLRELKGLGREPRLRRSAVRLVRRAR